ncbi:MAG: hypothetical protein WBV22_09005 [Anaerolineaceae bacterium]
MRRVKSILRYWLPMAVVITALSGLVYLALQQVLRQNANDPQIQMAEDTAQALASGASVESLMPVNQVDLLQSLAPFVIVYDDGGIPVASSGQLHGQISVIPMGVIDYVRRNGEDRITWQPEPGVRIASVIVDFSGNRSGFVLAGRSLREIEKRENQAEMEAGAVWIITLLGSLIMVVLGDFFCLTIK